MSYTYKTKIGNGMLEVTENDFKSIWQKAGFIAEMPQKCSLCGSTNVNPLYKTPKEYEYFGLKCGDCQAEQTFHQNRDGKGFFIKWDDKFEKYNGGGVSDQQVKDTFQGNQAGGPENFQSDDPNSIPF